MSLGDDDNNTNDPIVYTIQRRRRADRVTLRVTGMHCVNCARAIEHGVQEIGGTDVTIDIGRDVVSFEAKNEDSVSKVVKKIQSLGYKVEVKDGFLPVTLKRAYDKTLLISFGISFICFLFLMAGMLSPAFGLLHVPTVQAVIALPPLIIGTLYFGRSALRSLRNGFPNMDVLIACGILSAYVCSLAAIIFGFGHEYIFFEASTSIVAFVLLGNLIEQRSVRQTTSALSELSALQLSKAKRVKNDGSLEEVSADLIALEEIVQINTSDRIPVDGIIHEGQGEVDQSFLTGESTPQQVTVGDSVTGGSVLISGSVRVQAKAVGYNTVLSSIVRLVERASSRKPKIQRVGDLVAAWFVPLVLVFAISTFFGSIFFFEIKVSEAVLRSLAIIAVACPCAMGLAVPTAVTVALGRAARSGILVKGGDTLERLANVKGFIFDKTGTLTTNAFKVLKLESKDGKNTDFLASVVVALEKYSSHPIAKSLLNELPKLHVITPVDLESVKETAGISVSGTLRDTPDTYSVGGYRLYNNDTTQTQADIVLLKNKDIVAGLKIEDVPQPGSKDLLMFLKGQGLDVAMLSGDRRERCMHLAKELSIDNVYFEKQPHQKLEIVTELQSQKAMAYVGDGINDAPALEAASVGIALATGTDIAMNAAQVVLLGGKIALVQDAHKLARATVRTIKQNLFWAFFYNVAALPLAASGFFSPLAAALIMTLSDVVVIGNSLMLRFKKL